jgi:hypothetical protein
MALFGARRSCRVLFLQPPNPLKLPARHGFVRRQMLRYGNPVVGSFDIGWRARVGFVRAGGPRWVRSAPAAHAPAFIHLSKSSSWARRRSQRAARVRFRSRTEGILPTHEAERNTNVILLFGLVPAVPLSKCDRATLQWVGWGGRSRSLSQDSVATVPMTPALPMSRPWRDAAHITAQVVTRSTDADSPTPIVGFAILRVQRISPAIKYIFVASRTPPIGDEVAHNSFRPHAMSFSPSAAVRGIKLRSGAANRFPSDFYLDLPRRIRVSSPRADSGSLGL